MAASNTPRTDAVLIMTPHDAHGRAFAQLSIQLERELAEANRKLEDAGKESVKLHEQIVALVEKLASIE